MNYPNVGASEIAQLRAYKAKQGYSTASLRALMDVFGWTWQDDHIDDLLDGRRKPTEEETEYIKRFLLNKFLDYNTS